MRRSPEELARIRATCGEMLASIHASVVRAAGNPTRIEAMEIIKRHEQPLLELALEARQLANSYRNFDVGTVSVSLRRIMTPGAHAWLLRFAANTKEEDGEKYCGEQRLM